MRNVLIIYNHFLPAWKAGGPIRSIEQLIHQFSSELNIYVLCSAYDHGEKELLKNINPDQWIEWEGKAKVYYNSKRNTTLYFFRNIFNEIQPDIIFINGLYSLHYNIRPLIAATQFNNKFKQIKIILSPRGMLHPGALSQKSLKKRFYFIFFKLLNLPNKVYWHATDEKEVHFIRSKFKNARIAIAGNFPKLSSHLPSPAKEQGKLIMGTLALISPMKNHLEILKSLKSVTQEVVWHIYGPVKDQAYWDLCSKLIKELPSNVLVIYHGAIPPDQVSSALKKIQVFILPSKSENFGHAIFEALSAGKPVITTDTTPFLILKEKEAGITVSEKNIANELPKAIQYFSELNQEFFTAFQKGAIKYAQGFANLDKLKKKYVQLFFNI
jgi:glycosyltransferase involved in cell wall biosynthesis